MFCYLRYLAILLFVSFPSSWAGSSDSVALANIQVLTLQQGKMTTGRRSSPVPQLKCVGGTAGCNAFVPKVVQCYNRGSDGDSIQWECKTDMDNAFRFGQISVTCEGYAYRDDPYVLKGSCGLEYTLDLTKEGYEKQKSRGSDYYGSVHDGDDSYSYNKDTTSRPLSFISSIIFLIAVCLVIYALYKTCIAPSTERLFQQSPTDDDFPGGNPYYNASAPPPAGFRPEYTTRGTYAPPGASCNRPQGGTYTDRGPAAGFWTGAATGGLLGYMFGRRNNGTDYAYRDRTPGFWSSTSRHASGGGFGGGGSPSSGTRTASGFGGTTRR